MTKQRVKRITLFIRETLIILGSNKINNIYVYLFNQFIIKCYQEENELLPVLYDDLGLLKEFIDEGYNILTGDQIMQLINRYGDLNGYLELLDAVDHETDSKINELALQFADYHNAYLREIESLYNANPQEFYPKGFPKILQ